YFASRHGFRAPGDDSRESGETGVLTWPEGNAWLAERLAAPLGERLHSGRVVVAVEEGRDAVTVDAWNAASAERERWIARSVVLPRPGCRGWLAARRGAPPGDRLHSGRVVGAVEEGRDAVTVDAGNAASAGRERWLARSVVLATPLFVAARVLASPPPALRDA